MGLIAKNIETNPLDGVKKDQCQKEQQDCNKGYGIGYNFLHYLIFFGKNRKYISVCGCSRQGCGVNNAIVAFGKPFFDF